MAGRVDGQRAGLMTSSEKLRCGNWCVTDLATTDPRIDILEETSKQIRLIIQEQPMGPRGTRLERLGVLDSPTDCWWAGTIT